MGWFSRAKSWASSAYNSLKSAASSMVDKTKETFSKVWNAFTGKHYADEAEALHAEITARYDKAKEEYDKAISNIGKGIEEKISHINRFKTDIYGTHFKRFISIASRLHNVTVKGQPFKELFDDSILEVKQQSGVVAREDLMLIDFDNMGFLETAGMILTLGFSSRKKAKESLANVKEEEVRVYEEIAKMDAQQAKVKVVAESIDAVVQYFDSLIKNYEKLLDRFECGIQTQRVIQMSKAENVFSLKLDFRLIPIVHIEEFQALFNLSIVLKQMANLGFLTEEGEFVDQDKAKATHLFQKVSSTIQDVA
ncbi:DNA repair protein [Pseudoalteromonas lipolytica SCSIO 04301]|uniref:hypothetical protein n=1 Tax=Pseudoalteromonas lipolytica TaxID=570156 RepID=UPI0004497C56|nr:hypothetical protein [Pseudoalteromonas lipolytica]EWH07647.1 DNA repair protein [Pseudoalteromonas lipolytica SCSIO 04301]